MSMMTTTRSLVPSWTLGDRLRKAREISGMDIGAFSTATGISRTTITNYEHDYRAPRRPYLRVWADVSGVDAGWLESGEAGVDSTTMAPSEDGADVRPEGFEPPTFWSVAALHLFLTIRRAVLA